MGDRTVYLRGRVITSDNEDLHSASLTSFDENRFKNDVADIDAVFGENRNYKFRRTELGTEAFFDAEGEYARLKNRYRMLDSRLYLQYRTGVALQDVQEQSKALPYFEAIIGQFKETKFLSHHLIASTHYYAAMCRGWKSQPSRALELFEAGLGYIARDDDSSENRKLMGKIITALAITEGDVYGLGERQISQLQRGAGILSSYPDEFFPEVGTAYEICGDYKANHGEICEAARCYRDAVHYYLDYEPKKVLGEYIAKALQYSLVAAEFDQFDRMFRRCTDVGSSFASEFQFLLGVNQWMTEFPVNEALLEQRLHDSGMSVIDQREVVINLSRTYRQFEHRDAAERVLGILEYVHRPLNDLFRPQTSLVHLASSS